MSQNIPDVPPPSYEAATGGSSSRTDPSHLSAPATGSRPGTPGSRISTDEPAPRTARNGIPPEHRRSMEDLTRPLPPGWVRQFDQQSGHQFFVDTNANPPRSIWTHPYDDEQYLSTLSPEERKKLSRLHRSVTLEDLAAEDSDIEDGAHHNTKSAQLPPRTGSPPPTGIHKFGRKMKDKLTNTTHEQRQRTRQRREEEERQAYIAHMKMRQALVRALETGEPQLLGRDREGKEVYVVPPQGYGGRGLPSGAYGYNPYSNGPFAGSNVRYVRPAAPYGRPYGYGYGGGLGMPVAAGLLGGAMLGGLLF